MTKLFRDMGMIPANKEESIIIKRTIYDIEICIGVEELKRTIRFINGCGWAIVSLTQFEEVYTVLFRRPADG